MLNRECNKLFCNNSAVTNLCIAKEKYFERLLSVLAYSPHKLPQEAVKAHTEETIRKLCDI